MLEVNLVVKGFLFKMIACVENIGYLLSICFLLYPEQQCFFRYFTFLIQMQHLKKQQLSKYSMAGTSSEKGEIRMGLGSSKK